MALFQNQKKLEDRLNQLVVQCMDMEGGNAFQIWFMDDNHIPPNSTTYQRVQLVHAHLRALEADARYTQVDRLVGDECANPITIADIAELLR